MCGIVGVAGNVTGKEEAIFKQMLIMDAIRGEDSTGVAFVTPNREVTVSKTVGDPFQLFEKKSYRDSLMKKSNVIIGHNRYATTGKVVRANAHPFEFSKLVGVHNGTIKNKFKLVGGNMFDTDSEALYYGVNENGLKPTIKDVDGAYTLVWYNKVEHTINFLRNEERPLNFAFSEDGKVLFWASEAWMISVACSRKDYKIGEINSLPVNKH
jgi:glucosamine 6-phosphate synthetase-like amidotransferase/phosphosugar isomerase protein